MKKKVSNILLLFIAAAMLFSLAACGSSQKEDAVLPAESPAAEAEVSAEPAENAEPEDVSGEEAEIKSEAEETSESGNTGWIEELRASLPELPDIDIHSWEFLLANSYNCITQYAPNQYGGYEGQGVDGRITDAVTQFIADGRKAGYQLYMAAGLRNFDYNKNHYITYCNSMGSADAAAKYFLPPGCNEHQTGLGIDLTDDYEHSAYFAEFDNSDFLTTDAYKWALEHCQDYGFILRYPEGKEEFYGTPCHCAGHFRYVGKEAAEFIMENGLCLEEFISLYDPDAVYIPGKTIR